MLRKTIKKVLSILLTITVLLSSTICAFAAVDTSDGAVATALNTAKTYIDNLTINNSSNDPSTVVSTYGTQFTWDNEKRESANKSYLFEWSYYNGVVFDGLEFIYDYTKDTTYRDYVEEYMSAMIDEDGTWAKCTSGNTSKEAAGYVDYHGADCYKTASLLIDMAKDANGNVDKTSKYYKMATTIYNDLTTGTGSGYCKSDLGYNYWHSGWSSSTAPTYKVWLDGIYMIQPFMAEYAYYSNDTDQMAKIVNRFQWLYDNDRNSTTGLYYHALNSSTNYCNYHWTRAIGWYALAVVDCMQYMSGSQLDTMKVILKDLIDNMLPYQDSDTGMWANLCDKAVTSTNKLETSGTAMMAYAIAKGVNNGWIDSSYANYAKAAFKGIVDNKLSGNNLTDIYFKASASGSDNYQTTSNYYTNEGKGVGPFIMAYAQVQELYDDGLITDDPDEPTDPDEPDDPVVDPTDYNWVYVEGVTVYTQASGGAGGYYALGGILDYDIALGADFTIDNIKSTTNLYYKDSENGEIQALAWDSDEITISGADFNTELSGTYTIHVYASNVLVGDVTVTVAEDPNVHPVSVPNKISVNTSCEVNGTPSINDVTFQLLMSDGTYRTVQVTNEMYSLTATEIVDGVSQDVNVTSTAGKKVIPIDYSDTINAGFINLTVGEVKEDVELKKESHFIGDSFMDTGIANIELSVTGKRSASGKLDVLIISDVSNSMAWGANASSSEYNYNPNQLSDTTSKIDSMKTSIAGFADIILGESSNGTNTLSMCTFGGYDAERVTSTESYVDATRTLFTSVNSHDTVDNYLNKISLTMSGTSDKDSSNTYTLTLPDGASSTVSGTNKGGTNYDWGFWQAKEAIEQIYSDYATAHNGASYANSGRNLVVLFMSDGAPTFYNQSSNNENQANKNYYYGKSGTTDYDKYYNYCYASGITLSSYQNTYYSLSYYNQDGTQGSYSNGTGFASYFTTTPNLAAQVVNSMPGVGQMIAIGYHLETGGAGNYEYNEAQLTTLMSHLYDSENSNSLYTADTSSELEALFADIGNQVVTSVDAIVYDAVGESFELINCLKTSSGMPLKVEDDFEPSFTITKDGVAIEKVTFNEDGTEAYSSELTGNIMNEDGDVTGKYFTYDADKKKLTWTIGEISTETYKISYYAYLTGSQEGTLESGEYKTNEYAYAIVDTENPVEIRHVSNDFDVPTLSWYDLFVSVVTEAKDYDNLNSTKKAIVDSADYIYYVYFKNNNADDFAPMTGYNYDIYDADGEFIETRAVDTDGKIILGLNEKAVFNQNHVGEIYIRQQPSTTYSTEGWSSVSDIDNTSDASVGLSSPIETTNTGFNAEKDTSKIFHIDYICIISLDIILLPDAVVVDYGKTIAIDPLANDDGNFVINGFTLTAPQKGLNTSQSVKSSNGVFAVQQGLEDTNTIVPAGNNVITPFTLSSTHYIYPSNNKVETTNTTTLDRYKVESNGKITKYAANSSTGTEVCASLAEGAYIIDDTYLFAILNGVFYMVCNYEIETTTTQTEVEQTYYQTGADTSVTSGSIGTSTTSKTTITTLPDGSVISAYYKTQKSGTKTYYYVYVYDGNTQVASLKTGNSGSFTHTLTGYKDINGNDITITVSLSRTSATNSTNARKITAKYSSVTQQTTTELITDTVYNFKTKYKQEKDTVTYSLFNYLSTIDTIYYYVSPESAPARNSDSSTLQYSTIKVIPATTVYYEDDFGGDAENGGLYIQYTGNWYTVDDNNNQSAGITANTNIDNKQDQGEIGTGNIPYGYDSSYDDCTKFSNGTAAMVVGTVSKGANGRPQNDAKAEFTFTGTGFDIISRTDIDCGMITVAIYDENNNHITNVPVINKGTGTLYQIPVISYEAPEYGTYHVVINVNAPVVTLGISGSTFYLDAIRIYNPMGLNSADNDKFDEANDAYNKDHEANAYVASIRDYILQAGKLDETEQYGAVYVDTINNDYSDSGVIDDKDYDAEDEESEETENTEGTDVSGMETLNYRVLNQSMIKDFELIGPNEEVYLSPGYGVGFIVETTKEPASVQLEMKIPAPIETGASLSVYTYGQTTNIGKIEINSATEMFYDITKDVIFTEQDGKYRAVVVLENGLPSTDVGEILSITNLKLTYADDIVALDAADEEAIFTLDSYDDDNVAVTSLKASWNTYEDVFDSVYTHRVASTPNYEITEVEATDKIENGKTVTATIKTSKYVEDLIIKDSKGNAITPTSINSELDESKILTDEYDEAKTWTVSFKVYGLNNNTVDYTVESANGDGKVSTIEFTISNPKVTSISVYKNPKTSYKVGETFDSNGLILKVSYNDGSQKTISSGYSIEDTKFTKAGNQKIKVYYGGAETYINVTVKQTFIGALRSALSRFFK